MSYPVSMWEAAHKTGQDSGVALARKPIQEEMVRAFLAIVCTAPVNTGAINMFFSRLRLLSSPRAIRGTVEEWYRREK